VIVAEDALRKTWPRLSSRTPSRSLPPRGWVGMQEREGLRRTPHEERRAAAVRDCAERQATPVLPPVARIMYGAAAFYLPIRPFRRRIVGPVNLDGDDRLDCWATEASAVALADAARSTATDLEKNGVWTRPVGAYFLADVVALALIGLFRPHVTNDELLGLGRALTARNVAGHLTDRIKAHVREGASELAALPNPADIDQHVALIVVPRTSTVLVANTLEEVGRALWGVSHAVRTYPVAPVVAPLVKGFNGQARTGDPPKTRARGRPKKAEVFRLVQ
jgi:hypothetical protein